MAFSRILPMALAGVLAFPGCVSQGDAAFCDAAQDAQSVMTGSSNDPFEAIADGDRELAAAGIDQLEQHVDALADTAPEAIKMQASELRWAIDAMSQILRDHDYDLAAISEDPEALATLASLSSSEVEASARTVSDYANEHCDGVRLEF